MFNVYEFWMRQQASAVSRRLWEGRGEVMAPSSWMNFLSVLVFIKRFRILDQHCCSLPPYILTLLARLHTWDYQVTPFFLVLVVVSKWLVKCECDWMWICVFKIHQPKGVESCLVLVFERLITDKVKGIDRSVFCEPKQTSFERKWTWQNRRQRVLHLDKGFPQ